MFGEEAGRQEDLQELAVASLLDDVRRPVGMGLELGKPVGGTDWIFEGTLGQGGMAVVFAVVKPLAGIQGAMKVPHAELASHRGVSERFLEEARLYTSLKHPHIVNVIDCGLLAGGTPFMVMERLRGRTLRQVMRGAGPAPHALRPATAYEVTSSVCDALHRLHAHRPAPVVHRDVKPENVFIHEVEGVAGRGTVKLLDLGLADQAGRPCKVRMGTPGYMAPEQIRGGDVSERTDQYALALVVYEMLSGRLPWDVDVNDAEAISEMHLRRAPIPLAQFCPWIPASVARTLATALAKDPAQRLTSMLHFADGLRELEFLKRNPEADEGGTARTAPTLASLAAASGAAADGPTRPLAGARSSLADSQAGAAAKSMRRPEDASFSVPGDLPEPAQAPPAAPASSEILSERVDLSRSDHATRRVGFGSLGLGFFLGLGVALTIFAARSVGGMPKSADPSLGPVVPQPTRVSIPEAVVPPPSNGTVGAGGATPPLFLATAAVSPPAPAPTPSARAFPPAAKAATMPNADRRRGSHKGGQTVGTPAARDGGESVELY